MIAEWTVCAVLDTLNAVPSRLYAPSSHTRYSGGRDGLAKPAVRDDAGARAARPALQLRRAMAHRPGARGGERNPVPRRAFRLREAGGSGRGPTVAAEGRRHPS